MCQLRNHYIIYPDGKKPVELYCNFYYAKSHNIGKKFQRNFSYFLFLGENKYQYEENLNGIFTKHPRKPTIMVKIF